MHSVDPAELDPAENGRIVKTCIAPRPIAWISTRGEHGVANLAPFSCFNYVSPSPPVLMFATSADRDGGLKDTPRNVLDTGEFAVNVVTARFLEQLDETSEPIASSRDEFDFVGLETAECETIDVPRVAGAVACLECELHDTNTVYDRLMVLGEVNRYLLSDEVLTDGRIDARAVDLVGRLGGPHYTDVTALDRTVHLLDE